MLDILVRTLNSNWKKPKPTENQNWMTHWRMLRWYIETKNELQAVGPQRLNATGSFPLSHAPLYSLASFSPTVDRPPARGSPSFTNPELNWQFAPVIYVSISVKNTYWPFVSNVNKWDRYKIGQAWYPCSTLKQLENEEWEILLNKLKTMTCHYL